MQFEEEKLTEALLAEALPLLREHFKEIYPEEQTMADKFAAYLQLAKDGVYHVMTVRDAIGTLCGYAGFYLRPHPHKADSIEALSDVLYLSPSHRGQGIGKKFIRLCDEMLKEKGVVNAMYSVPQGADTLLILLDSLGYAPKELVLGRKL